MNLLLIEISQENVEKLPRDNYVVMGEYHSSQPEIGAKYKLIAEEKKQASAEYRKRMERVERLEKEIYDIQNPVQNKSAQHSP
jgi:hypothetical protein